MLLVGGYAAENSKVIHREFGKCSLFRSFGRGNKDTASTRKETIMLRKVVDYAKALSFCGLAKSESKSENKKEHELKMDELISVVRGEISNRYRMEAAHIVERMICAIDARKTEQEMCAELRPMAEQLAKAAERAGEDALEPMMERRMEYACLLLRRRGYAIRNLVLKYFGSAEELERREERRRERAAAGASGK